MAALNAALNADLTITTCEMHTGGEPLRIVESGYPQLTGDTILEKRRNAREKHDHIRKFLIYEPRGHYDMYGAVLVSPDLSEADLAVLFLHNEGYSTMCGHAVIALGRYAVDRGLVKTINEPETQVNIQCPCGLVKAYVQCKDGKSGAVRFHSVPAFAYKLDVEVDVAGYGCVKVDIGYGGAFYALIAAQELGLDVRTTRTATIIDAATAVSDAVKAQVAITHPESADLSFLYGTILTDGHNVYSEEATANVCVFAAREVDRSPTGSGVTARVAVQFARGQIAKGQTRTFESGANGSTFLGSVHAETRCGDFPAVVVEVAGKGYYHGKATFTLEEEDNLKEGFLLR